MAERFDDVTSAILKKTLLKSSTGTVIQRQHENQSKNDTNTSNTQNLIYYVWNIVNNSPLYICTLNYNKIIKVKMKLQPYSKRGSTFPYSFFIETAKNKIKYLM